jgi:hypothetical protein
VVEALLPHIPKRVTTILEPAAGNGAIVKVLQRAGYKLVQRDLARGQDYLLSNDHHPGTITNPPYGRGRLALRFIEHALEHSDFVAMLLQVYFDFGQTRKHVFRDCKAFVGKIVLVERILWFPGTDGDPSDNHARFVWVKLNRKPRNCSMPIPAAKLPN